VGSGLRASGPLGDLSARILGSLHDGGGGERMAKLITRGCLSTSAAGDGTHHIVNDAFALDSRAVSRAFPTATVSLTERTTGPGTLSL
jgi:hypothetical protein